ncbi:maltokinase N-terminal cap-like domain-containing protein, partial [Cellulosimicrobium funkei]
MTLRRTDLPSSELMTLLDAWLPERRWYPVKGVAVRHVPWLSFALDVPATAGQDPARDPRVVLHLLRLLGDGVDLVVQVPLVLEPGDASPAAPGDAHTPGGAAPS